MQSRTEESSQGYCNGSQCWESVLCAIAKESSLLSQMTSFAFHKNSSQKLKIFITRGVKWGMGDLKRDEQVKDLFCAQEFLSLCFISVINFLLNKFGQLSRLCFPLCSFSVILASDLQCLVWMRELRWNVCPEQCSIKCSCYSCYLKTYCSSTNRMCATDNSDTQVTYADRTEYFKSIWAHGTDFFNANTCF